MLTNLRQQLLPSCCPQRNQACRTHAQVVVDHLATNNIPRPHLFLALQHPSAIDASPSVTYRWYACAVMQSSCIICIANSKPERLSCDSQPRRNTRHHSCAVSSRSAPRLARQGTQLPRNNIPRVEHCAAPPGILPQPDKEV